MNERGNIDALVIGASGQVGGAICEQLTKHAAVSVVRAVRTANDGELAFDLRKAASDANWVREQFVRLRPRWAFIAAGLTNVDQCEADPVAAREINATGPGVIASAARSVGARTVYYSTEYVFDGENGPYEVDVEPRPISVYGQTKLDGERAVLDADPLALILRTTVVFGPEDYGKNFAYRLATHARSGEPISVPDDQISSPTYNRDLAEMTIRLLEGNHSGIFHTVGEETMDRVAFTHRVAAAANLEVTVRPVKTSALNQGARRPLRAGLKAERTYEALGFRPMSIENAIADWRARPRGRAWP